MVDKGIQNSEIPEPTRLVESILRQTNDVALIREYGLWLAKTEPQTALQVCLEMYIPLRPLTHHCPSTGVDRSKDECQREI